MRHNITFRQIGLFVVSLLCDDGTRPPRHIILPIQVRFSHNYVSFVDKLTSLMVLFLSGIHSYPDFGQLATDLNEGSDYIFHKSYQTGEFSFFKQNLLCKPLQLSQMLNSRSMCSIANMFSHQTNNTCFAGSLIACIQHSIPANTKKKTTQPPQHTPSVKKKKISKNTLLHRLEWQQTYFSFYLSNTE